MSQTSSADIAIPRWRTVTGYGVVASAWIVGTDLLAHAVAPESFVDVEVFKGWFFVAATAVCLKVLIDRHIAAIRRSERRLHSVIDCMADAVILVDRDGNTTRANRAAVSLFGVSDPADLLGPFRELARQFEFRTSDGVPIRADGHVVSRALVGETIHHSDLLARRRDGKELSVAASVAPVPDGGDGGTSLAVAVLRDVTEMKRLERMRDEFLSMAAHELKTPITTLKAYVQILRRQPDSSTSNAELFGLLNRQCNRMARLVQELLEVSRLEVGRLRLNRKTFDLSGLASETMRSLGGTIPDHHFVLDAQGGALVNADPERIHQVFVNLLDNAVKYSRAGGEVVLRVRRDGEEVVATVADSGIGIAANKLGMLFERFSQAHAGTEHDRGGMGLGLYICREILSRHHGRIWVHSEVGRGSEFHFCLPAAPPDARAEAI